MSRRVMDLLTHACPQTEVYSIDEAFLQLDGMPEGAEQLSQRLRDQVFKATGIPISIGIGPTKTLAKLANHIAKRVVQQPVYSIRSPEAEHALFRQIPVTEVWGIGRRWGQRLASGLGVTTVEQLRNTPPAVVRTHLSVVGERIVRELNGEACLELETIQPNQQIMCSKSFGTRIHDLTLLQQAISNYAARACVKLRDQQLLARGLQVFLHTGFHDDNPYSNALTLPLPVPSDDSRRIIRLAKWMMNKLFRPGYPYQKAGILLLDLTSARTPTQNDLFVTMPDNPRLMRTIDTINRHMGRDQLFFAAQGMQRPWGMRSEHRSPRYTTCWQELVRVQ
jgi:DNA polymerase V